MRERSKAGGGGEEPERGDAAAPVGKRAHVYGSATYPYVKPNYDADTDGFRQKVDAYFHPDGVNLLLSNGLFDLERSIEAYSGTNFVTKKTEVIGRYWAASAADRDEIHRQNQWRRLVDAKFTNPTENTEIWTELTRTARPGP